MNIKKTAAAVILAAGVLSLPALEAGADWESDKNGTYYTDENGSKARGLEEIDGETYYFDSKGYMQTGWQKVRRKYTCYFRKNGTMVKGKAKIKGKVYYFDSKGRLITGIAMIGGKIYDCGDDGVMGSPLKNRLVEIDNKLYYAGSDGAPAKGMRQTGDGNCYYFGKDGYSVSTTVKQNGYIYEFDKELGLISQTSAPADTSKINVDVGVYSDEATNLNTFRCHNNSDGSKFFYSGWIKNVASQNSVKITVDMELYGKDGDLITTKRDAIVTTWLKMGDEYKINGNFNITEPVYKIKFNVSRLG